MAFGAKLEHGTGMHIARNILKNLGAKSLQDMVLQGKMVMKDGAPATDTGADNPQAAGVLCWDYTNDAVYICTEWTSATVFNWYLIDMS